MNIAPPQGPTIPASTNFITNFTRLLKVTDSIRGTSFSSPNPATPGTNTVLSGGTLSNLNDPVLDSQGATYAYAQAHGGSGNPGGPLNSVQYNDSGAFGGSSSLTFDHTTNTLTANKISNGIVTIGSNTISGLSDPTSGLDAATKNYVDNSTSLTIVTNSTVGPTTYNAADIINSIIYRDTQTSGTTTDSLPTAAQIVVAAGATVGTTIYFGIKNVNASYDNIVNFTVGSGITFDNTQNIFSGYEYNGVMIVTNATSGSEAITLYSLSCSLTNTVNWGVEIGGLTNTLNTMRITDYLLVFNNPTQLTNLNAGIYSNNVAGKILYVNEVSPLTVAIQKPDDFMGVIAGSSFITAPFLWHSGGTDFYVVN